MKPDIIFDIIQYFYEISTLHHKLLVKWKLGTTRYLSLIRFSAKDLLAKFDWNFQFGFWKKFQVRLNLYKVYKLSSIKLNRTFCPFFVENILWNIYASFLKYCWQKWQFSGGKLLLVLHHFQELDLYPLDTMTVCINIKSFLYLLFTGMLISRVPSPLSLDSLLFLLCWMQSSLWFNHVSIFYSLSFTLLVFVFCHHLTIWLCWALR